MMSYVIRFVAPILAVYKPGVEVYFSSDDVVIELIDNYPRNDLDAYVNSFNLLIDEFSQYFPNNLKMELKQVVPDYYTKEEYNKEFRALYEEYKQKGFTQERIDKLRRYFEFNFQMNGKEDFTNESQKKVDDLWSDLMFWSDAYLALPKRKDFVRGEDKIVLFSQPIPKAVDIGSTNVSKAKFWAGIGILEYSDNKYYDRILSPKQWKQYENKVHWEKVDIVSITGFDKIPIVNERLNFLSN
jgi:hypothetical protein